MTRKLPTYCAIISAIDGFGERRTFRVTWKPEDVSYLDKRRLSAGVRSYVFEHTIPARLVMNASDREIEVHDNFDEFNGRRISGCRVNRRRLRGGDYRVEDLGNVDPDEVELSEDSDTEFIPLEDLPRY